MATDQGKTTGQFRALHTITTRKPPTESDMKHIPTKNSNLARTFAPGDKFDPLAEGITQEQATALIKRGHMVGVSEDGDMDADRSIARIMAGGPAPVPTTDERDRRTAGANTQRPGGSTQRDGNTSPLLTDKNKAPATTDHAGVSSPTNPGDGDAAAERARTEAAKDRPQ